MKESTFVPESWSSYRVTEVIQNIRRVSIEFPKLGSGIGLGTLHLSLVINPKQKRKEN